MEYCPVRQLPCPIEVCNHIESLVVLLEDSLGPTRYGVVVTGSLSRGVFQQDHSDVDLLVLLNRVPPTPSEEGLGEFLGNVETTFDITFVTRQQLGTDAWPTPVVYLGKTAFGIVRKPSGSRDFLLQRQDAFEAGLQVTSGPHVSIRYVPQQLIAQCIGHVLPFIRTHFKNRALMLCRVLFWQEYHRLSSKEEAGVLVMDRVPAQFRSLISADLDSYRGNGLRELNDELLGQFEEYVAGVYARGVPT